MGIRCWLAIHYSEDGRVLAPVLDLAFQGGDWKYRSNTRATASKVQDRKCLRCSVGGFVVLPGTSCLAAVNPIKMRVAMSMDDSELDSSPCVHPGIAWKRDETSLDRLGPYFTSLTPLSSGDGAGVPSYWSSN